MILICELKSYVDILSDWLLNKELLIWFWVLVIFLTPEKIAENLDYGHLNKL